MIFDTVDSEFLKLIGFCRYMPTGLQRRYDAPMFTRCVISNLQEHGLIKMQSDGSSIKLTGKGINLLAEMGYEFSQDARIDLKKPSYRRKLKNAQWNVMLYLAGIDIYYKSAKDLTGVNTGYMSSLTIRSDKNMKVLAGTRFLGVLKHENKSYIPYHIENAEDWIIPAYEKEIYSSQVQTISRINEILLILTGDSLEELWCYTHNTALSIELGTGRKRFINALEEMGSEYLLIPFGQNGVVQLSTIVIAGYRDRIAKAIGCMPCTIQALSECDGIIDNIPYIIAFDMNVNRIVRALRQIEKYNRNVVPRICCMPFQKSTVFKLLKAYKAQKTAVITIDKDNIYNIFPELYNNEMKREPYITREGEYLEVVERKAAVVKNKASEDR